LYLNHTADEIKDEMEFRMFSDCITISCPYIDFGIDFKERFYAISILLNTFQQVFMSKGFYLRGHVTIGSHYSDDNMIFSGGLVEAYSNDGSTVYPAISIIPKVLDKISKQTEYDESMLSFEKMIIQHRIRDVQNNTILNPFFTLDSFQSMDQQLHKLLKNTLGPELNNLLSQFSIQDIFEKEFKKHGLKDITTQMEQSK